MESNLEQSMEAGSVPGPQDENVPGFVVLPENVELMGGSQCELRSRIVLYLARKPKRGGIIIIALVPRSLSDGPVFAEIDSKRIEIGKAVPCQLGNSNCFGAVILGQNVYPSGLPTLPRVKAERTFPGDFVYQVNSTGGAELKIGALLESNVSAELEFVAHRGNTEKSLEGHLHVVDISTSEINGSLLGLLVKDPRQAYIGAVVAENLAEKIAFISSLPPIPSSVQLSVLTPDDLEVTEDEADIDSTDGSQRYVRMILGKNDNESEGF